MIAASAGLSLIKRGSRSDIPDRRRSGKRPV